jgi:hypothetical protein
MSELPPSEPAFACELSAAPDGEPFVRFRSVLGCTACGAVAGLGAAALVGTTYVANNPDEPWQALVVPFTVYVIVTGAFAFGALRLAMIVAPRWPVLAGLLSGAMVGIAPGAYGATTFGSLSMPFVGAIGFALAGVPFVMLGVTAQAIGDGAGFVRAISATLKVTIALSFCAAMVAAGALLIGAPTLLESLRGLLFLGLDGVGVLSGIVAGVVVGGAKGLGVRLAR